jgi:hypothetical protein
MTTSTPNVPLTCPTWCVVHDVADANLLGGGVTTQHESEVLTWSKDGHSIGGIRRIDEFADGQLEGIYIHHGKDAVWDISADEARRLALVLMTLADEFERG